MESGKKRKNQVPSISLDSVINILIAVSEQCINSIDLQSMMLADNQSVLQKIRLLVMRYLDAQNIGGCGDGVGTPASKKMCIASPGADGNGDDLMSTNKIDDQYRASNTELFKSATLARTDFNNIMLTELIVALEAKQVTFMFPKEMLKYFLATANRFIIPVDFANTGFISNASGSNNNSSSTTTTATSSGSTNSTTSKSSRSAAVSAKKSKNSRNSATSSSSSTSRNAGSGGGGSSGSSRNSSQLTNGAILNEYGKGLDIFIAAMARSDESDILALKNIIRHDLYLSPKMYAPSLKLQAFTRPQLTVDTVSILRPDYAQIMFTTHKQMYVLLTSDIVMVCDNQQFVIPSSIIEREFTWSMKQASELTQPGDYVVLDVLFATKARVIDLIAYSRNNVTEVPESYEDRLNLIRTLVPGVQITTYNVTPSAEAAAGLQKLSNAIVGFDLDLKTNSVSALGGGDISYISKPMHGFGPTYIYNKYSLTAAAVGIFGKNVALAFLENDCLVVRIKTSIAGPLSYLLTVAEIQDTLPQADGKVTIKHNGVEYPVQGDLREIQFFKYVLPVEVKDGIRWGCISTRPISTMAEYKPVVIKRDVVNYDDIRHTILQDVSLIHRLFCDSELSNIMSSEKINQIRNILNPYVTKKL